MALVAKLMASFRSVSHGIGVRVVDAVGVGGYCAYDGAWEPWAAVTVDRPPSKV
ncbi:hypothetical protein ACFVTT_11355 [Streptomyces niveus]|uniref:hypothetical protein n=1 Tax=Streptomyces niveus TaxID=193462 RepID=UPI003432B845